MKLQREAVVSKGLEGLFMLKSNYLPFRLFSWIVSRQGTERKCLKIHGKNVSITEEDVHRMFGVDISTLLVRVKADLELEENLNIPIVDKMIDIVLLKKRLLSIDSVDLEFIVKFILYAVGKVLSFNEISVKRSWVPVFANIDRIGKLMEQICCREF